MKTLMIDMDDVITRGNFYEYVEEFMGTKIDMDKTTNYYIIQETVESKKEEFWKYVEDKDLYKGAPLFDDCYEERYNEFLTTTLGDMIYWDTLTVDNIDLIDSNLDFPFGGDEFMDYYKHQERIEPDHKELTANKVTKTLPKTGFLTSVASELVGHAEELVKSKINKVVLGNLYNFSLSQSVSQVKQALSGHVFSTANAIKSYTSDDKKVQVKYVNKIGNIYQNQTIANNI